jgi:hypothetical protein
MYRVDCSHDVELTSTYEVSAIFYQTARPSILMTEKVPLLLRYVQFYQTTRRRFPKFTVVRTSDSTTRHQPHAIMRCSSLLLKIVKFTISEIRKEQQGWSLVILEDTFSDLKPHDKISYRLSIYRATQRAGVENYWQKPIVNLKFSAFFYNMLNSNYLAHGATKFRAFHFVTGTASSAYSLFCLHQFPTPIFLRSSPISYSHLLPHQHYQPTLHQSALFAVERLEFLCPVTRSRVSNIGPEISSHDCHFCVFPLFFQPNVRIIFKRVRKVATGDY